MGIEERLEAWPVALLYGGSSRERKVSLLTGEAVGAALKREGFVVEMLDWPRDMGRLMEEDFAVAVIALHGGDGENGAVQGFCEVLGVPYTGSGVLASALAMDKVLSKTLAAACGVRTAAWHVWTRGEAEAALERGGSALPMAVPVVVKPSADGSSVGVTVLREEAGLEEAVSTALTGQGAVLFERYIGGSEVTVGVADGVALGVCEVRPAEGFYDFEAKYERGDTEYVIPTGLGEAVEAGLCESAERLYAVFGCRGVVRVDFLVEAGGEAYFLELNTIPGMTATSLVPKIAASRGEDFDGLVRRMLKMAALDGERL